MMYDGDNPTTYPYGHFYLYQQNPLSPVKIKGKMKQMPPGASLHGFAINEKAVQFGTRACKTAGMHWNPTSETHGEMNNMTYPSHIGNLKPVKDDMLGNAWYWASADRPTMYGKYNILKKAMTIYENDDDFGLAGTWHSLNWGTVGAPIACCNIRGFHVTPAYLDTRDTDGRSLDAEDEVEPYEGQWADFYDNEEEDFDHFTLEEFEELFGKEETEMLMAEEIPESEQLQLQQNP